jgi:NADPH-dependent glutamate synthase beta subunit-like oxidoreductase
MAKQHTVYIHPAYRGKGPVPANSHARPLEELVVRPPEQRPEDRIKNSDPVMEKKPETPLKAAWEAAECINCETQPCSTSPAGCPPGHEIPAVLALIVKYNELIQAKDKQPDWERQSTAVLFDAHKMLSAKNPLYVYGQTCPADSLCQGSCTVTTLNDMLFKRDNKGKAPDDVIDTVRIQRGEAFVWAEAWKRGWIEFHEPKKEDFGAGPAGLSAALELRKLGNEVTVYEREPEIGGLLETVLPPMKWDASIHETLREKIEKSGIKFELNTSVGAVAKPAVEKGPKSVSYAEIAKGVDGVVLASGTVIPNELTVAGTRDQPLPGGELAIQAYDFLSATVNENSRRHDPDKYDIKGKVFAVIGAGDTAMDCLMMLPRLGAAKSLNIYHRDTLSHRGRKEVRHVKEEKRTDLHLQTGVTGIERIKGGKDAGRLRLHVTRKGVESSYVVDGVISAVGFRHEEPGVTYGNKLEIAEPIDPGIWPRGNYERVFPVTGERDRPVVIAVGDFGMASAPEKNPRTDTALVTRANRNGKIGGEWLHHQMQLRL